MVTTAERVARAVIQNSSSVRCFPCLSSQIGVSEKMRPEKLLRRFLTGSARSRCPFRQPPDVPAGEAAVMNDVPLILGQIVRHTDRANVGVIVGFLLGSPERAIVRWVGEATLEAMEDITDVRRLPA
jgi:hypothetical protein